MFSRLNPKLPCLRVFGCTACLAVLFGASGLEALAQLPTGNGRSVLDQVAYMSAVSGGSIAASYYVLNKPPKEVSMLTAEGNLTGAYRVFFDQYRDALSQSFGNE